MKLFLIFSLCFSPLLAYELSPQLKNFQEFFLQPQRKLYLEQYFNPRLNQREHLGGYNLDTCTGEILATYVETIRFLTDLGYQVERIANTNDFIGHP